MVLFHNSSSYSVLTEASWKMSPAARIREQRGLRHSTDFRSKTAKLKIATLTHRLIQSLVFFFPPAAKL